MLDCIKPWDERREIAAPGTAEATHLFCVKHFIAAYEEAVADKGSFFVALSGGSTPKIVFNILTSPPYVSKIDWSKVHLFWGDERSVGATDPDSNFKMAMDAGFSSVAIPFFQIHRMEGEKDIEAGALAYEKIIRKELQGKGLDYLILGMGDDGHTASLFPGTKALEEKDRLVVANHVPQKDTYRMTFTFPYINAAKHIVIYVVGKKKHEKVKEIRALKENVYPIQRVGTKEHKALWIIDDEALS
jgi:6-phosphogluconolactonase